MLGRDIAKVQSGWPVGMAICRALGGGLWEVRASRGSRSARCRAAAMGRLTSGVMVEQCR